MKKPTAIKEFIELITLRKIGDETLLYPSISEDEIQSVIDEIQEELKQAVITAFNEGYNDNSLHRTPSYKSGEDYFNKTIKP